MIRAITYIIVLGVIAFSCNEITVDNGLSPYQNQNLVSDFASELWIEGNTFKGSFSNDFNTFYFFRKVAPEVEKYVPYQSSFENGSWGAPKILEYYNPEYSYTYQLKVPQSNDLYFISNMKTKIDTSLNPNYNIWKTSWIEGKYAEPKEFAYENIVYNYNSQPCITKNGTIYFTSDLPDWRQTHSYRMEPNENGYSEPKLFEPVNNWRKNPDWSVFEFCVSPDEKYLIASIEDKTNPNPSVDLYISYYKDNQWTSPTKLDHGINSTETENFPTITNDGKYLIFTRAFSEFKIVPTKLFNRKK